MSWSLNIGTIAGTAIRVHITFLLFLGWIFAASYASGGPEAAWATLAFVVLLFACVVAHEFGHIFTARAFGVPTTDVTLLPIGGVARLERIPEAPREEFLIAIAGPLVNVAIAFVLVLLAGARLNADDLNAVDSMHVSLTDRLAAVNIILALFNMISRLPDGRRAGAARAARVAAGLRARDRDCGRDRPGRGFRARLHRIALQSDTDLHRHLRLSGGGVRSAFSGIAINVTRCPGEHSDDDAIRDLEAASAC